ncbi:aa3-type cytochrome c oxidase subunit IV [Antarcticirhabdus aurantiaca]|uniref:Aa3-type cytochrome c oxidase subunit IV n=1 Tax=Antarcticirhabdus aurantiaca TaxID=2606717 RepID=A0ACD4NTB5_9HYPH|nr:aa3-type cytochrome c oxidase subunit IV [Antarcticirhabdus aurantiaca]WAJ30265.1 aa3-type cytochrome c oxidase subunit IV [Jeongeuplla avenae]
MAELPNYDTVAPAEMDYPEHERTYDLFLAATKWGTIGVIAILVGMLVGLIAGGGFIGGIGTFLLVLVVAWFVAR